MLKVFAGSGVARAPLDWLNQFDAQNFMPVSFRPRNCSLCGLEILLKGCAVLRVCEKLVAFCGMELSELDLHLFTSCLLFYDVNVYNL